jgi:Photosynthesis affected mutant 68
MSSEPPRNRLPFEPGKNRKSSDSKTANTPKSQEKPAAISTETSSKGNASSSSRQPTRKASKDANTIPEVVNRRMMARIGLFSGTPTLLGILSLVGSYFVVTREWFPLPSIATLLVSMGFFGLGVLGVSYGALSASWDEEDEGSKLGLKEFKTNLGRMFEAWRASKEEKSK